VPIDSIWSVHSGKLHTPDAYPHPRTVIRCRQGIALFTQEWYGVPWLLEAGTWSLTLVDNI